MTTTTPDHGRGSSSQSAAYARPGLALVVAVAGFVVTGLLVFGYPYLRAGAMSALPAWLLSLLDLVILSLPLVAAVVVAVAWFRQPRPPGVSAARAALGLSTWRWTDIALGVSIALVVRAAVELISPSTGSLGGAGFGPVESPALRIASTTIVVLGAVIVSPVVEELFFRGLVLRAMLDVLTPLGGLAAGIVSIVVSTGAFVALHLAGWGTAVPLVLLVGTVGVGLGAGILLVVTRRLAGALAVHIAFNALGVAILLI